MARPDDPFSQPSGSSALWADTLAESYFEPKRQRLKLAEELWFSGVDDSMPVAPRDEQVLDERWAAYRAGKAKRISLSELERRLRR